MSGYQYPENEEEIFLRLKEFAELNDIEGCIDVINEWFEIL